LPGTSKTALSALLERARRKTMRIWDEQSPYELKDELKQRGYRWSDGADGRLRSWYVDVDQEKQTAEIEFLRKTIYLREVEPRVQPVSAFNRFSVRALIRQSNVMECRPRLGLFHHAPICHYR
jgi:DNA polymerase III subunit epsilon